MVTDEIIEFLLVLKMIKKALIPAPPADTGIQGSCCKHYRPNLSRLEEGICEKSKFGGITRKIVKTLLSIHKTEKSVRNAQKE